MSKNTTGAEMPEALRSTVHAALKHAQKVLNYHNLALDCVPVNEALAALGAAAPAVAPGITYLPAPALQGLAHQGCSTSVAAPSASQPVARIVAPFPGMDEPWPEEQKKRLAELCGEIFGWPQQGETAGAVYAELPRPGSPEASAMIDSVLAEYNYPSNTKNAARAGFEAARRMLAAAPHAAAASGAPVASAPMSAEPSDSLWKHVHKVTGEIKLSTEPLYATEFNQERWSSQMYTPASPTTVQAVSGLEEERALFKEQYRHLDLAESLDAWGRPKFTHSHVDALWNGWRQRAAVAMLNAGASGGEAPAEGDAKDAARYRWLRDESWAGYNSGNGTPKVFTMDGAGNRKMQLAEGAMDTAIDAALAAKSQKGGAA